MREQLEQEIAAQEALLDGLGCNTARYDEESAKLDEMKAQLAAMEARETVSNQFEQLDFGNGESITLREVCVNEDYYQLLSIWIQTYIGNQAEQHAAIVNSYKSKIEVQEQRIYELGQYADELQEQVAVSNSLHLAINELESRRNAAASELAEAKEELKRLNADNESLRAQLEAKSAPATPQVDPAELFKRIQAAKPGIYNKRWSLNDKGLEDRRFYAANLSATGEEITIPLLEIGKYREETPEEAERFRQEQAQLEAERLAKETMEQGISVPSVQFPDEDADVQAESDTGTLDDAPVTRAEFEALKEEVRYIAGFAEGRWTGFVATGREGAA